MWFGSMTKPENILHHLAFTSSNLCQWPQKYMPRNGLENIHAKRSVEEDKATNLKWLWL